MSQCQRCGAAIPYTVASQGVVFCSACSQPLAEAQASAPGSPRHAAWQMFPVTSTIVALNIAVFVVMVLTGSSIWGATPVQLIRAGANYSPAVHQGQLWRLLTAMFIHIGVLHLAFNMWAFWNLGQLTEALLGRWRFLTIYLLSGIAGSALSYWLRPVGLSAGASGAIFGTAGALIAVLKFAHLGVPSHALKPVLRSVVSFAGYNLLFGAIVPHIDNLAHFGGLLAGFGLGLGAAVMHRPQGVC